MTSIFRGLKFMLEAASGEKQPSNLEKFSVNFSRSDANASNAWQKTNKALNSSALGFKASYERRSGKSY